MQYAAHPHSSRQPQAPPPPTVSRRRHTSARTCARTCGNLTPCPAGRPLKGTARPPSPHTVARARPRTLTREVAGLGRGRLRRRQGHGPRHPRHPQGTLPNPPTHAGARARPHALMLGSAGGGGCSAGGKGCDRAVAATPTVRPPPRYTPPRTWCPFGRRSWFESVSQGAVQGSQYSIIH